MKPDLPRRLKDGRIHQALYLHVEGRVVVVALVVVVMVVYLLLLLLLVVVSSPWRSAAPPANGTLVEKA